MAWRTTESRSGPTGDDPGSGPQADPVSVARTICLNQLDRAPRTRAELEETLRKRLVPEEAATLVLDRLTEVGLIDDEQYARAWVRSRHTGKRLSGRALARELAKKGVDLDTIAEVVAADVTPESEESAAVALVLAKLRSMDRLDRDTKRRRLASLLGRKGYNPELIWRVVRREVP